jgi:hypothetical protein
VPRKPDTPCSVCGTLMWSGKGALPPGERTCRPCRAAGIRRTPKLPKARHRVDCPCGNVAWRPQPQTYCSLACTGKYKPYRRHLCEVCTAQYRPTFSGQRTCGRACGVELQRLNRPERVQPPPCSTVRYAHCRRCDDLFVARSKTSLHCRTCKATSACGPLKPAVTHTCAWCGDAFTSGWSRGKPKGRRRTYCGDRCARKAAHAARAASRPGQFKVSPRVRRQVHQAYGYRCHLCDRPVRRDVPVGHCWYPTLDHLVPRSLGGSDEPANLATAHMWCNSMRGVAPVDEARVLLAAGPPPPPAAAAA